MSYMDNILSQVGEDLAITDVTKGDVDKYGDRTDADATKTVRGHVQVLSNDDDEVVEGNFKSGDLHAFFDSDALYIKRDNKITYRGQTYIMDDVVLEPSLEGQSHYEVFARKT